MAKLFSSFVLVTIHFTAVAGEVCDHVRSSMVNKMPCHVAFVLVEREGKARATYTASC